MSEIMTRPSVLAALALLFLAPAPALAYMGPGIGLGAIGTALGILGAILLMLVSLLWYPVKRLTRRLRGRSPEMPATTRPRRR
jgi:hypothetical protein